MEFMHTNLNYIIASYSFRENYSFFNLEICTQFK